MSTGPGWRRAIPARFCKILNPLFDGIRKARDMEKCLYEGRTFLWTFIVGHLKRLGNRANRYVLEAKLVTPWGSAYSVMSVPIKPWHDKDDDEKQVRLARVPEMNCRP